MNPLTKLNMIMISLLKLNKKNTLTFNQSLGLLLLILICLYLFFFVFQKFIFQEGQIPQTPIIIVNLCTDLCGLGNQLFRYAAALGLAAKHAQNHTICIFGLQYPSIFPSHARSRLNQHIDIIAPWSNLVLNKCPDWVGSFHLTKLQYVLNTFSSKYMDVFEPPHSTYVPFPLIKPSKSLLVNGCMQSFKYFDSIFLSQKPFFRLKQQNAANLWIHHHQIDTVIHVRRGDKIYDHSPIVPVEYYEKAMQRLPKTAKILVCTDDATWVRSQSIFENTTLYSKDPGFDMALIAAATETVIIGIGTFAWWGAFLSQAKQVYYYPIQYQGNLVNGYVEADYIPSQWIPISPFP